MATAPAQEWATCSTTAAIGLPLRAIATARYLYFNSDEASMYFSNRRHGHSVRLVKNL